ncbi:RNA methyltransferase [Eubacterium sp. 1001713B170207_170306_E7]|uniref:TrmH family RNA methyltransferase n=1 Tax=Eubacterium sp. 1001713B170207_170306_E7 TaxID=2787097 RepID=UPI00189A2C50|nr:RNA methyltransferase [Eubacterium sp. 1001713B170207_170306_E7]
MMTEELITSRQNAAVKSVIRLKQKKNRDREGLFILEGTKLFIEAEAWKVDITSVYVTPQWLEGLRETAKAALKRLEDAGIPVTMVDFGVFEAMSALKMPEGVLCTARKFDVSEKKFEDKCKKSGKNYPTYVILDDVQDPGNVGTIIRTADAAGFDGIVCSLKTADIYNEKVLRGAMGSVFHLPVLQSCDLEETVLSLKEQGVRMVGTSLQGNTNLEASLAAQTSVGIVLGNESKGMSRTLENLCDVLYKLPMYGHAESLNVSVAAGILMYDIARAIHK